MEGRAGAEDEAAELLLLTLSGRVEVPLHENELLLLSPSRIAGLAPGALSLT